MGFNENRLHEKLKNHTPHPDGHKCGRCKYFHSLIYLRTMGIEAGRCGVRACSKDDFDYCDKYEAKHTTPKEVNETCHNCDGCKKLDFYYCANCGRQLR